MPVELFFDHLGVRLNGDRAAGLTLAFNLDLTDTKEKLGAVQIRSGSRAFQVWRNRGGFRLACGHDSVR
jgi:alkyl sulfatase BDS1-like metallo-beta-lactamase superfamily hydrolase